MKTSKKIMLLCAVVILTTALVSWNHFNSKKQFNPAPVEGERVPPAEDVLIKKIPGDNNHLLMMAFYSKENYSGQFVTINKNGSQLVFRDDGRGDDKVAGDGLFTAKIEADINEFRKTATSMNQEMKKSDYKPLRYVNRATIVDPDQTEDLDLQALDRNEAVSISGLAAAGNANLAALRTHSMVITDLSVVEDPARTWNPCKQTGNVDGAWTFKTLMKQIASPSPSRPATDAQVSDFVKNWLNHWAKTGTINGDVVAARPLVTTKILNPWLTKSKNAGSPTGQLNMKFAPFKLTAIVNRFDLRNIFLKIPAGQARLVFCLINSDCNAAENFNMIFEYNIPTPNNCDAIHQWAQQWYNLKDLAVGSSAYNQALQAITNQFTLSGSDPGRTNQSALGAIRTNDLALSPSPGKYEFREFHLASSGVTLKETTIDRGMADRYNAQVDNDDVRRMVDFVNTNDSTINSKNQFTVPATYLGSPLLGGKDQILGTPVGNPPNVYHWDGTNKSGTPTFIINFVTRFIISENQCSGCHAGETQTSFTHIDPVFFGKEATLSGFLAGKAGQGGAIDSDNDPNNDVFLVKDAASRPAGNVQFREFNEIKHRAQDLNNLVNSTCGSALAIKDALMFQPVDMVH
jgi:hypothetical protein